MSKAKIQIRTEEFVELWEKGIKGSEIAKELGVPEWYVYDYARTHREDCKRRKKGPESRINDKAKFIQMWTDGVKAEQIARYFNVTRVAVTGYARRHRNECPSRINEDNTIPEERKDEFIEMWNSGVPGVDIAEHFNVNVYGALRFASKHRDQCPRRIRDERSRIDHDLFVKLWNEDVSGKEIGKIFNVGKDRVYKYANMHRDECIVRRGEWTLRKINPQVFAEMWNNGCSCREIAEHFGVTEKYVRHFKACSKADCMHGLAIRRESKINPKELIALRDKGVSSARIAEHFGVTQSAVCHYIKRNLQ